MASQRWRAAMEYYVGLDVSLKQTSICVVDQSGSVVREGVVDSDPEAISVYVRSKAPGAVRIGLERPDSTSTRLNGWSRSFLSQKQAQVGRGHGPRRDIRRGEGPSS